MSRFSEKYKAEVAPALMKKFGYSSVMQIPKFNKIVINVALLYYAAGSCLLNSTDNDVTYASVATAGTAKHSDTEKLLGTGVVSDLH